MSSGQIVGRVSVRVLPDTGDFRKDLKRQLAAIEKTVGAVHIKTVLELNTTSLRTVKAQLDHFARGVSPLKVKVEPNMLPGATALIAARMDIATRPRTISVIPKLSSSGVAAFSAQVGTMLAALSGARLLSSTLSNIWGMFKNMDKLIPLISGISLGVAGLAGLGLTAASNLFALSVSLAQIGVLGLTLPGILTGIGIGLGVTVIAMKGLKTALPDVDKQFQKMKSIITKDFWSGASVGIRNLATIYLPQLGATAKTVGTFWGKFADALSKPFQTALGPMFDSLNKSIKISADSASVFASIITQLGLTGSSYLPRLAQWFVDISTQFDSFLKRVNANGSLKEWTDAGIVALHDLGQVISNVVGIFTGLGRAASAAGGSSLGTLADTLERIHKAIDTPAFQTGLTNVLRSAHEAMSLIAEKSGPVSKFFETFGKTLSTLLPTAGATLGTALAAIADALSQPAFQKGLTDMFAGIQKGVDALAPVLPSLGVALGKVGEVIGTMATSFGPVLAVALQSIVDIFLALTPAITALIPALSVMLLGAITALTPFLVSFAGWLGQSQAWLLPVAIGVGVLAVAFNTLTAAAKAWAAIQLVAGFVTLMASLTETMAIMGLYAASAVASAAKSTVAWVAQGIAAVASTVATVATVVAGWISMAVTAMASGITMAAAWLIGMGPVGWVIAAVVSVIAVIVLIAKKTTWFQTAWEYSWNAIKATASWAVDGIKGILGWFASLPGLFSGWFNSAKNAATGALNSLVSYVKGIPGRIVGALGNLGGLLTGAGAAIMNGLWDGMAAVWDNIAGWVSSRGQWIKDHKGPESYDRTLLIHAGQLIMQGLQNGLESQYDSIRKSLSGFSLDIANMAIQAPSVGLASMSQSMTQADLLTFSASAAGGPGSGATSADIQALGDRFGAELDRQARTIQTMQRQMAGA